MRKVTTSILVLFAISAPSRGDNGAFTPALHNRHQLTSVHRQQRTATNHNSLPSCCFVTNACPLKYGKKSAASAEKSTTALSSKKKDTTKQNVDIKKPKALSTMAGFKFLYHSSRGQAHKYLTRLMKKHGDNFIIWNKYITLTDPLAAQDVLEKYNLPRPPDVKRGYRAMFYSGGILAAPWEEWKIQRRMTAPALAEAVVGELCPKFDAGSKLIFEYLENAAREKTVVEMDGVFNAMTLDIIGLVLLGKRFGRGKALLTGSHDDNDDGEKEKSNIALAFNIMTDEALRHMVLPAWILKVTRPPKKVRRAKVLIDDFLEDCINTRLEERASSSSLDESSDNEGKKTTTDMLNILLDANSKGLISRDDVKGQLLTFIFGGQDTTGHTMSWLLWEVSQNADLQENLASEARKNLPSRDSFPTNHDIQPKNVPLLHKVWQETLRKHPPTPTGTTRSVESIDGEPIIVGHGLELPTGTSVTVPIYALHHNEKYWPDPEKFDPSRFDEEEIAKRDPMTYMPFSAGPKKCMGGRLAYAEAMSVLLTLFRRYQVECVSDTDGNEPVDYSSLTRRPKNGIFFTLTSRP